MTTRIKLRRDTAANWLDANPILAAGEPGLETDTGKIKYGDGETAWALLEHAGGDTLNNEGGVVVTAGSTNYWMASQRRENNDTVGRGVRHDSQGNVYAVTQTNDGDNDVAVITKYSTSGSVVWQHTIDKFRPYSLAVDSADCAYIAGENKDNNETVEVWKFSTSGAVLWKKNYDGGAWTGECFIEERTSTRLTLVANRDDGDYGVLVLDINSTTGEVVTKKLINLGGPINVYCSGIDTDASGNVFVTGRYYDPDLDKYKMFIEKLDSSLDRVWSKSLDTETNFNMDTGDCASDAQGNVYAVAYYLINVNNVENNNGTGTVGLLVKLNSAGVTQWTRRLGPGPCGSGVVGLTATPTGDLYLSTITITPSTNPLLDDQDKFAQGDVKMIVSRYDAAGEVVWQRYIDDDHTWEINDNFRGQAISVYDDRFVTDYYGNQTNNRQINYSDSDDNESDCFIVQLPTDGTDLEIGTMAFKASRIPGRFITQAVIASPTSLDVFENAVVVSNSTLTIDSQDRIANSLVRSESYDYVFGADGTLTIPNDGDVKLTQSQIGFMATIGGMNNNWSGIENYAVVADSQGFMYVGGEEYDSYDAYVAKISPEGAREWSVRIGEDDSGHDMGVRGIALDPATGHVKIVCDVYGNYVFSAVITIDPDTGRILSNVEYRDGNADVNIEEVTFLSTGTWVMAGSRNGNFSPEQTVTKQTGSTTSTLIVLRSEVDGIPTNQWQIGGTGFSVFENLQSVESYTALTSTVRQGSGAVFDIADNGDGTYLASGIQNNGTNYRIGHKIKVLGTALGGATPANDCIVTVDSLGENDGIFLWSVAGTAAGSVFNIYGSVTGTNIDVGSGATFSYQKDPSTSNYENYYNFGVVSGGSNYANNDVLTISGDQLGGTSPANDLVLRAYTGQTALSPVQSPADPTGTAQTSTWKLLTNTAVDFAGTGTWQLTYPLSRENLLLTENWQRTYGTNTGDYTDENAAVAIDSGDNIITVGQGYGIVAEQDSYTLATVYKFNSTGTLQWARKLNNSYDNCYAKSVATIGTDIYVTHDNDGSNTVITKLSADGTVQWQRSTSAGGDQASVVVPAGDGDILVMTQAYQDDVDDDAIKIFKMTSSGETVYKRWFSANTSNDTRLRQGRNMAVRNGYMYIAGHYDTNNSDSTWLARLPVDGTGTGEYGQYRYEDVNQETGSYDYTGLTGVNYTVNEINLGDSLAGALTVEPYVNTVDQGLDAGSGDYITNSFYVDYFMEAVRDTDGGRIVFPDGTTQDTSAIDVPQRIHRGDRYVLSLRDRGHHVLSVESNNDGIVIPYYARVPFPVGSQIVLVNNSGNSVNIGTEGSNIAVLLSGSNGGSYSYFYMNNGDAATLLNIGRDRWVFYGNVDSN